MDAKDVDAIVDTVYHKMQEMGLVAQAGTVVLRPEKPQEPLLPPPARVKIEDTASGPRVSVSLYGDHLGTVGLEVEMEYKKLKKELEGEPPNDDAENKDAMHDEPRT